LVEEIGEEGEANEDEAIFGNGNLIWNAINDTIRASGPARLTVTMVIKGEEEEIHFLKKGELKSRDSDSISKNKL